MFRREIEKTPLVLAAFDDERITRSSPSTATEIPQFSTNNRRGIQTSRFQDKGRHRGGRALAMRAGNRHTGLAAHQVAEHLAVRHLDNTQILGAPTFGVVRADGRAVDQHVHVLWQKLIIMAGVDSQSTLSHGVQRGIRFGNVRTCHLPVQVGEQFGQGLHAAAADTDKMCRLEVRRKGTTLRATGRELPSGGVL